jgi:hypothetical protein
MLSDSQLALAALAGRTLVDAASTDEWETVRRGYAPLLGRGDVRRTRLAEQRLDETHEQLTGAVGAHAGLARAALAARWSGRLADLLEENPDAEADLHALVLQIQAALHADAVSVPVNAGDADQDPGTLAARNERAYRTGQAGDAAAARDEFAALLPAVERVFGPEHPDTLATRASLAYWAGRAGDAAAARDEFALLLPVTERVLGPDHRDTLINRHHLANMTGHAGDAAGARDQFAALLPVRVRVSGPEHPDTLTTRFNLAFWTAHAGQAAAAKDQFAALLPIRDRVLGPEHPDTLATRAILAQLQAG